MWPRDARFKPTLGRIRARTAQLAALRQPLVKHVDQRRRGHVRFTKVVKRIPTALWH
jgi:hypothetical protein